MARGYKTKRGVTMHEDKVGMVMSEFKHGKLHSSSGERVKSREQAMAIAMSEAGKSRKKKRRKR